MILTPDQTDQIQKRLDASSTGGWKYKDHQLLADVRNLLDTLRAKDAEIERLKVRIVRLYDQAERLGAALTA
jgi:hypothetical protein